MIKAKNYLCRMKNQNAFSVALQYLVIVLILLKAK